MQLMQQKKIRTLADDRVIFKNDANNTEQLQICEWI
jgi:hypothetical protein